jgi:hypothetical protein
MAPLDSVLDIDGNRYVFDRLRALIESRRAIAFSGPDTSAGLYPLWPDLVNLLIGEAVKRGLAFAGGAGPRPPAGGHPPIPRCWPGAAPRSPRRGGAGGEVGLGAGGRRVAARLHIACAPILVHSAGRRCLSRTLPEPLLAPGREPARHEAEAGGDYQESEQWG